MRLSVVIPAFNEELVLRRCLDSLAVQQTSYPYEVIVVDNNSSDATAAIAGSYPFVRVVHERRRGVAPARQALAGLRPKSPGVDVVHLIYRSQRYENHAKDYEFSRLSMEEHWQCGMADMRATLQDPRWIVRQQRAGALRVFDLAPPHPKDADQAPHDRRRPEMQGFRRAEGQHGMADKSVALHRSRAPDNELPE